LGEKSSKEKFLSVKENGFKTETNKTQKSVIFLCLQKIIKLNFPILQYIKWSHTWHTLSVKPSKRQKQIIKIQILVLFILYTYFSVNILSERKYYHIISLAWYLVWGTFCISLHESIHHFRIYRIQMTDYIRRLVTHPVLDLLHYRSISYYNIINNELKLRACWEWNENISLFPLWTSYLYVAIFQQHLHNGVYLSQLIRYSRAWFHR
jgi:hypothetical protein